MHTTQSTQHRKPTKGFTLVELMAVLMILGLVITVTAANWRKIVPRAQLNAAVRNLSNVLNGTRSEAIARNAEFRNHNHRLIRLMGIYWRTGQITIDT